MSESNWWSARWLLRRQRSLRARTAVPSNIAGMVVFIDPGHNGSNDASIGRQVTTGRGGTKDCQTSGTATNSGYPEHTFTWDTALRVRAALNALGVTDRHVPRQRHRTGTVYRRARQHGQLVAAQRDPEHPRRRRPTVRPGIPRQLLGPTTEPGAGRTVGAVRADHARSAAGFRHPAGHLHRPERAVRALGPDRSQPGAVPRRFWSSAAT